MVRVIDDVADMAADDDNARSRDLFRDQFEEHYKKAAEKRIRESGLDGLGEGGGYVLIPKDAFNYPKVKHDNTGGVVDVVSQGNEKFRPGDIINKQRKSSGQGQGQGQGKGKGNQPGEGNDKNGGDESGSIEYVAVWVTDEDLLKVADFELPNLVRKNQGTVDSPKRRRAGRAYEGSPHMLDVRTSYGNKIARINVNTTIHENTIVRLLEEEASILSRYNLASEGEENPQSRRKSKPLKRAERHEKIEGLSNKIVSLKSAFEKSLSAPDSARIVEIEEEIARRLGKIERIPAWTKDDVRYNVKKKVPQPATKAVIFFKMDVSGSMGEKERNTAKVFCKWLKDLVIMEYGADNVETVFIAYTSDAQELLEKEFFNATGTGGTVSSSGNQKMLDIIKERYPPDKVNIYGAHVSDGENFPNDRARCEDTTRDILKVAQAYFYAETSPKASSSTSELWDIYNKLEKQFPGKIFKENMEDRSAVWPLLNKFFGKDRDKSRGASPAPNGP